MTDCPAPTVSMQSVSPGCTFPYPAQGDLAGSSFCSSLARTSVVLIVTLPLSACVCLLGDIFELLGYPRGGDQRTGLQDEKESVHPSPVGQFRGADWFEYSFFQEYVGSYLI